MQEIRPWTRMPLRAFQAQEDMSSLEVNENEGMETVTIGR